MERALPASLLKGCQGHGGSASCLSLWERWLRPTGADGEGTPLPCGELPPQRLRGLQIGEAKKMRLAKRLAFFRFDFCFGVTRGEQPLVRGSSASKSLALFWFSFGAKREQSPPGCSASKSLRPCRAEHAAFASQTGLRLKSPTGAFMPSGHRRPFWFSFVRQKRTSPPCEAPPKMHPNCKSKMQAFCVSARKTCIFIFCPETLQKALTTAFPHAILNT